MATDIRERQRRRKITLACEPCRARKSRCDGRKPICSTCEQRALGLEECVYKAGNARTACSDEYTKALHERIRLLEQACAQNGVDVDAAVSRAALRTSSRGPEPAPSLPSSGRASPSLLTVVDRCLISDQPGRHGRATASSAASPESMDPENATGVTAMGTMLSEEDLDAGGVVDAFYGRSSAASFLKEAARSLPQRSPAFQDVADGTGLDEPHARSADKAAMTASTTEAAAAAAAEALQVIPTLAFTDVDRFTLPPRALADHLLQRFFSSIFYLYPFFDRKAFEQAYGSLWQSDAERRRSSLANCDPPVDGVGLGGSEAGADTTVFHSALNSVFALGCCFSDLPEAERTAALDVFLSRSKSFVGIDFIDKNNLAVVQAMLINSLVMQGTPFPNRCWNAVGVACRLAQGLGLHTEGAGPARRLRSERVRQIRQRTWHGCVVMDVLVSMTYGRPPMTSSLSIRPESLNTAPASADPEMLKLQFHRESVKLSVILEDILQRIYQPWRTRDAPPTAASTTSSASGGAPPSSSGGSNAANTFQVHHNFENIVEIQGQLDHFEQSVAPCLSWTGRAAFPDSFSVEDQHVFELARNVLQARFVYLQLILYRPILSQLTGSGVPAATSSSQPTPMPPILSSDGLRYSFALECGKSCVEAAKRLMALVHNTYLTRKTEVWWWNGLYACTAGLVLIVARSCPALWKALDPADTAVIWDQCQSILKYQASFSASARKSLNLLLKVNEHVLQRQAAGDADGPGSAQGALMGATSTAPDSAPMASSARQAPVSLDFMAQLDAAGPSLLEDTYTMGLFTWDPGFDFSDGMLL